MYFVSPADVCDTVIHGNMCVACECKSNKSEAKNAGLFFFGILVVQK